MIKPSDALMEQFYQQLGRVFFLVAYADKDIHENEVAILKKTVNDIWLDFDHTFDETEADTGYQIEYMFDFLMTAPKSENAIITDFKVFVNDHKKMFNSKTNRLILETCEAIAKAFEGVNNDEERVIEKIRQVLLED